MLATALAGADDQRCQSLLLELLREYPAFTEARIALAAAIFRQGDTEAATHLMAGVLTCSAPPENADFCQLADRLVSAGRRRWASHTVVAWRGLCHPCGDLSRWRVDRLGQWSRWPKAPTRFA
jgi:hypothetical protein